MSAALAAGGSHSTLAFLGMSQPLTIRAGETARRTLFAQGFNADQFSTLVGASGGAKWIVLRQLDRWLIDHLISPRQTPIATLGSSIGSFRHACLAMPDARAALDRFFDAYVAQRYETRPTGAEVSAESARILDILLGEKGAEATTANPLVRMHVVACRLYGPGDDSGAGFRLRIGLSAAANAVSRTALRYFYERAVFGPETPAIHYADLATRYVPIRAENVRSAILASGSIPMVMRGVRDIPGLTGTWLDGGIVDYHFDFRFQTPKGLILYPHFFDRMTPGWFDKPLRWRRPRARDLDRVVMIAPSDSFVEALPGGRVPDRHDFECLANDERIERWKAIDARCHELVEDLRSIVEGDQWQRRVQPFSA